MAGLLVAGIALHPTGSRAQISPEQTVELRAALAKYETTDFEVSSVIEVFGQMAQNAAKNIANSTVFDGQGTVLDEDGYVWAKAAGDRINQYASGDGSSGYHVDDMIYSPGGQKALAPS